MKSFLVKLVKIHYRGNRISYILRKIVEKINIRKAVGMQLASIVFVAGIVAPQTSYLSSTIFADNNNSSLLVQDTQTKITFIWPLTNYILTQPYRFYHPAVDLATTSEEPVMVIADGIVESVINSNWGYGKHIIVKHENGYHSLYGHLSRSDVKEGQEVKQGAVIGVTGNSGWSTGMHLHLEINGPDGTIDPLDTLPANT